MTEPGVPAEPSPTGALDRDRPCLTCGYNLRGLGAEGVCPECGTPVERSLQGNLLRFSGAGYLALLHRGIVLIQAAVIAQFLTCLALPLSGLIGAGVYSGQPRPRPPSGTLVGPAISTTASCLIGLISVIGWWMFSAPDPALGGVDEGTTARRVVRCTIIIQAATGVLSMAVGPRMYTGLAPKGLLDLLAGLLAIVTYIALIVWFFAAMRYVRQIAPRLPSDRVFRLAKLLGWLGPVLCITLCLGFVVDLILYYNLLEWIRKDLKAIRAAQAVDGAGGATA